MKTQKFLVEVTIHDTDKPLNADNVIGALDEGFDFPGNNKALFGEP